MSRPKVIRTIKRRTIKEKCGGGGNSQNDQTHTIAVCSTGTSFTTTTLVHYVFKTNKTGSLREVMSDLTLETINTTIPTGNIMFKGLEKSSNIGAAEFPPTLRVGISGRSATLGEFFEQSAFNRLVAEVDVRTIHLILLPATLKIKE